MKLTAVGCECCPPPPGQHCPGSLSPSKGKSSQRSCPMVCRALPAILHLLTLLIKQEGEKNMATGDKTHIEREVN